MPTITTETDMLAWLDERHFQYAYQAHTPVFTCDESSQLKLNFTGANTKNLFLRDRRHNYYLYMTTCERQASEQRADLKTLGRVLNAPKIHFASPEELYEILGLTPGSVTALALVNDRQHQVHLWVEATIWEEAQVFLCHPLINTATLALSKAEMERFFSITGHKLHLAERTGASPGFEA